MSENKDMNIKPIISENEDDILTSINDELTNDERDSEIDEECYAKALEMVNKTIQAKLEYKYNTPRTKFITTGDVLNKLLDIDKEIEVKMFFTQKGLENFINTLKGMIIHYKYQVETNKDLEIIKDSNNMLEFLQFKSDVLSQVNPKGCPDGIWLKWDDYDIYHLKKAYEESNSHIATNIFDEEGDKIKELLPPIDIEDFIDTETEIQNIQYNIDQKIEEEYYRKNKEMLHKLEMAKQRDALIQKTLKNLIEKKLEKLVETLEENKLDLDTIIATEEFQEFLVNNQDQLNKEDNDVFMIAKIDKLQEIAEGIINKQKAESNFND